LFQTPFFGVAHLYNKMYFILTAFLTSLYIYPANSDVIHILGEKQDFCKEDIRIVSLAPSITETLYFLGLFENIVGVTRYDDFPEGVKEKDIIGGYLDVDIERILKLQPDVILCEPNSGIQESVEIIKSKGIPVIVISTRNVLDILIGIEDLGRLFGREREAYEILTHMSDRYRHLLGFIKADTNKTALMIINENPLVVAGYYSFVGELLNLVGLKNAYSGNQKYPVLDNEILIQLKPDLIFNISESVMSGDSTKVNEIGEGIKPFLKEKTEFYVLKDSSFVRPSPRFIDALERLFSLVSGYYL